MYLTGSQLLGCALASLNLEEHRRMWNCKKCKGAPLWLCLEHWCLKMDLGAAPGKGVKVSAHSSMQSPSQMFVVTTMGLDKAHLATLA